MAAKSDYYDLLGISKGASEEEIKKAYRTQAIKWHPDKHKEDKETAEKKFKEINEAYQVLSDKEKRAAYDKFGHNAFSPGGTPGGGAGFGGFPGGGGWKVYTSSSGGQGYSNFDFGDPFDIFEQFFGGGNPFGGRRPQVPRYSITIDFMEAILGVQKEVSIDGKKKKIKIPAGINEGQRIRFDDFILSVNIRPHKIFERNGDDILVKVFVPFSTMILGGQVEVPTLEGDLKIKIRKGTKGGSMMRFRGKGAPKLHGRGKGDHYVKLEVDVPDRITRDQRRMIEKLEKKGF